MEPEALVEELRRRPNRESVDSPELEPDSWTVVFAAEWPKLVRIGSVRFRLSREDAEDALQECGLRITQAAPVIRNREAYLHTAFYNCSRDILRRRGKLKELASDSPPEDSFDPSAQIYTVISIQRGLGQISPLCRTLLNSWICEDVGAHDLAREHSLSRATIYKRLARCLRKLTDAVESE